MVQEREGKTSCRKKSKKKESKRQTQGPDDVTATSDRVTEVKIGGRAAAGGPAGSCPGHRAVRYGAQSAEDRMPPSIRLYG